MNSGVSRICHSTGRCDSKLYVEVANCAGVRAAQRFARQICRQFSQGLDSKRRSLYIVTSKFHKMTRNSAKEEFWHCFMSVTTGFVNHSYLRQYADDICKK